ncbi:MAG: hypothetical protein QMB98_04105 [Flaviflexus sp.]|uniref:hypothetical protein n=1 Tax=Flaviflexus sp. TaxID=1969482 RepID=UPI00352CB41D
MNEIQFDWDAAGITAKTDWTDSQTFVNIAGGVQELLDNVRSSIVILPVDQVGGSNKCTNDGVNSLRSQSDNAINTLYNITQELSDACAMLGSGTEAASANFDDTEQNITQDFDFLTSEAAS